MIAGIGPADRIRNLARLADDVFDVLVVGGGVVGSGAALDAASRGLTVALIDAKDWAAGTSSRSSKLVHGGLRYLEHGEISLVREALRERSLLVSRLAPHLVQPVRLLLPLRRRYWDRTYLGVGTAIYDLISGSRNWPRHQRLDHRATMELAPALNSAACVGSIVFHDAQVDDARLTLSLVRTAVVHGTAAANYVRAISLTTGPDGRIHGVQALDAETGARFRITARAVIIAAGVHAEQLCRAARLDAGLRVRASKGVHLVVARDRLELQTALVLRTARSVLFVLPWGNCWLIGTTDTEYPPDGPDPTATEADISYLLEQVNGVLRDPIRRDEILGTYAGLRPLVAAKATDTVNLSREHVVSRPAHGLTLVSGGKLTTYRIMARDAVDAATRDWEAGVPPSVTSDLPLLGAGGYLTMSRGAPQFAATSGLSLSQISRLLRRYGSATTEVLELIAREPQLSRPLGEFDSYLAAEVVYAVEAEAARHVGDVLERRTRLSIESPGRAFDCVPDVAELMSASLGLDMDARNREISTARSEFTQPLATFDDVGS